jgi:outer membrane lipoprotein SlyB
MKTSSLLVAAIGPCSTNRRMTPVPPKKASALQEFTMTTSQDFSNSIPRTPARASLLAAGIAAALALSACAVPVTRTTHVYEGPATVAAAPAVLYGTVSRIDVIDTTLQPTGGGTVLGALIGGVVGNEFGHGAGRAAMTAIGAVGGAAIGTNAERQQAAVGSSTIYRVVIAFDNGSTRSYDYHSLNGLRAGERVRLQGGLIYRS